MQPRRWAFRCADRTVPGTPGHDRVRTRPCRAESRRVRAALDRSPRRTRRAAPGRRRSAPPHDPTGPGGGARRGRRHSGRPAPRRVSGPSRLADPIRESALASAPHPGPASARLLRRCLGRRGACPRAGCVAGIAVREERSAGLRRAPSRRTRLISAGAPALGPRTPCQSTRRVDGGRRREWGAPAESGCVSCVCAQLTHPVSVHAPHAGRRDASTGSASGWWVRGRKRGASAGPMDGLRCGLAHPVCADALPRSADASRRRVALAESGCAGGDEVRRRGRWSAGDRSCTPCRLAGRVL